MLLWVSFCYCPDRASLMAAGKFVTSHVAGGGGHVASREDYNMGMSEVVARRRVIVRTPERISKVQAMRRIRCLVH